MYLTGSSQYWPLDWRNRRRYFGSCCQESSAAGARASNQCFWQISFAWVTWYQQGSEIYSPFLHPARRTAADDWLPWHLAAASKQATVRGKCSGSDADLLWQTCCHTPGPLPYSFSSNSDSIVLQ